jgi:type IV pilus assembly protein PilX
MYNLNCPSMKRQRGFSLIMVLIFLVLLTILGVTAMQTSTLEERMAGNLRNENLAFQAAESALREAEAFLSEVTLPSFDTTTSATPGLYHTQNNPWGGRDNPQAWAGWAQAPSTHAYRVYSGTLQGVATAPRYVIEQLPPVPVDPESSVKLGEGVGQFAQVFRITARGTGGSDNAVVFLQTTFWR